VNNEPGIPKRISRRQLLKGLATALALSSGSASAASAMSQGALASRAVPGPSRFSDEATFPTNNVYAAARGGLQAAVAELPPRVYVPHELGGDVAVIDPASMQVVDRFPVGQTPHHVTPAYDLGRLYVNVMGSNRLVVIDPREGRPATAIPVAAPYNLYFTPDGSKAIVAAEPANRLDFYDPSSWQPIARLPIPASGVDHLDFSADGSYLLVSGEFGGQVVKVDVQQIAVAGLLRVGGRPIDVKLAPDGSVFYIANQGRHGVSIVDPLAMQELDFLPTGLGAHGLAVSRDAQALFVSNRLAGSISVISFEAAGVATTWWIGGSPDMLQVSPDGQQLWASGRAHGSVYVVDTNSGQLLYRIPTGSAPHGLTYFPQPGRFSIGHNGVYR
jgi:DNA-binding beta-propeller fold protein YncE